MSLPIQLISTDFDGTLHSGYETPPIPVDVERVIGRLQKHGAKWIINTGRDLTSLMQELANAQLSIRPDFVVVVEREIYKLEESEFVSVEDWNKGCTDAHAELFRQVRPHVRKLEKGGPPLSQALFYKARFPLFFWGPKSPGDAKAFH